MVQLIGMPEAQLTLAHATIALAVAPSRTPSPRRSVRRWLTCGREDRWNVPPHLRDAHYSGAPKLGHGTSLHLQPRQSRSGIAEQQYARTSSSTGLLPAHGARRRRPRSGELLGAGAAADPRLGLTTVGAVAIMGRGPCRDQIVPVVAAVLAVVAPGARVALARGRSRTAQELAAARRDHRAAGPARRGSRAGQPPEPRHAADAEFSSPTSGVPRPRTAAATPRSAVRCSPTWSCGRPWSRRPHSRTAYGVRSTPSRATGSASR